MSTTIVTTFFLLIFLSQNLHGFQKTMSITIDDLPYATSITELQTRVSILDSLIQHSKNHNAPFIGFVNGNRAFLDTANMYQKEYKQALIRWTNNGLLLGNHTYSHSDYNNSTLEQFKLDILKGEEILNEVHPDWKQNKYFRHPFLHRGDSPAKVDSLARILVEFGYKEAPVTIDNYDFQYAQAYERALLSQNKSLADSIAHDYIRYMCAYVDFYEQQIDALTGTTMPQILLLHANVLNRDYLGVLLQSIKEKGYVFITLEEALKHPNYSELTDNYAKKWGISWIHRWALSAGKKGAFFKGEPLVPEWIK